MPESTIAFSTAGTCSRNRSRLLRGAEAHDRLDAGAVVPAAVEDHDLAGRGEVRDVALDVHLRLLALGRRGERDDAEDARADALGDPLDRAALARRVAPFEDDADLRPGRLDPLLEGDELAVQALQLLLVALRPSFPGAPSSAPFDPGSRHGSGCERVLGRRRPGLQRAARRDALSSAASSRSCSSVSPGGAPSSAGGHLPWSGRGPYRPPVVAGLAPGRAPAREVVELIQGLQHLARDDVSARAARSGRRRRPAP